ncbi:MAG: putative F420-0 ABC transporter substrate-binding protein [Homoserinimonas sp.]
MTTRLTVPAMVAAIVLLTGCSAAAVTAPPEPEGDSTTTNCGIEVSFSNPQRVVTVKSSTTEMLLALGLEDRIVGTAFADGPVPEQWADAAAGIPVISEKVPSEEAVLGLEPDLVYAGWESNFSADGAGERSELQSLGVDTYVSPSACQSLSADHPALTADDIFAEISEVASIFETDATLLVSEQRAALEAVEPISGDRTALWFSSGSDTPFVGGGTGAPQVVLDHLGLTNIAAELGQAWAPFNWEAVVDENPDVIVLVDSAWNSAEKKIGVLEANPVTARLDAVVNHRYLVIPFPASEAGVRTIPAIVELSGQLRELELE